MYDLQKKNIDTCLAWINDGGVLGINQRSFRLYLIGDEDYNELYNEQLAEHETKLSKDDYAIEMCRNSLEMAFFDKELINAGMDWEHPERFEKMLLELKEG